MLVKIKDPNYSLLMRLKQEKKIKTIQEFCNQALEEKLKRMKFLSVLLLFALMGFVHATATLSPSTHVFDASSTPSLTQSFVLLSTNPSSQVSVSANGSIGSWLSFNPSSFTLSGGIGNFTVTANPGTTDVSGYVVVSETYAVGNSSQTDLWLVYVTGKATKWIRSKQFIVSAGREIGVEPVGYRIVVKEISDTLTFDLYADQELLQDGWMLSTDAPYTQDDLMISVDKLYSLSKKAVLTISSTDSNANFSLKTSGMLGTGAKLEAIPSSHSIYKLTSDSTYTITETITNKFNDVVTPTNVVLQPEGADWFHLGSFDLKPMQSGDKMTIPVIIEPGLAPKGTSNGKLVVYGDYRGDTVSAEISYSITIAGKASVLGANAGTPSFQIPSMASIGMPFTLQASNVLDSDAITPVFTPMQGVNCNPASVTVANNVWTVQCTIVQKGVYSVYVTVARSNLPIATSTATSMLVGLTKNDIEFVYSPELKIGAASAISFKLKNDNSSIFQNNVVTVNNEQTKTITPAAGTQYIVCVDVGVDKICENTQSSLTTLAKINLMPDAPVAGELVSITASDVNSVSVNGLTCYVDSAALPSCSWTASEGVHLIKVVALNYAPLEEQIMVGKAVVITSVSPASPQVGDSIAILFTEQIPWKIVFNNSVLAQGLSNTASFKAVGEGDYTVFSGSRAIRTLSVTGTPLFGQLWFQVLAVAVIAVIIVAVALMTVPKIRRRRLKGRGVGEGVPEIILSPGVTLTKPEVGGEV